MLMTSPAGRLTPHVRMQRVAAVLNVASGSVGPHAAEKMRAIAAEYGVQIEPRSVLPAEVASTLAAVVAERPDVLIVLAGDGTLALSARLCGPDGPLLAALPGGTMNMLPFALNGRCAWPEALRALLETGRALPVSSGELNGQSFYVAAILGSPALWADAREAVRRGKLRLAVLRARRAVLRAFKGRLRFAINGGARRKAEALTLMCPLVSRGLEEDVGLEAAALDVRDALDGFRLGLSTLMGSWRKDPSVRVELCQSAEAWAHGRVPVLLDGEPHRLSSPIQIRYRPAAFRALVPAEGEAWLAYDAAGSRNAAGGVAGDAPVRDGV